VVLQTAPRLCGAYETDQFTNRLNPITDSTAVLDEQVTVIAVLLKGSIDLYREDGQAIESN